MSYKVENVTLVRAASMVFCTLAAVWQSGSLALASPGSWIPRPGSPGQSGRCKG